MSPCDPPKAPAPPEAPDAPETPKPWFSGRAARVVFALCVGLLIAGGVCARVAPTGDTAFGWYTLGALISTQVWTMVAVLRTVAGNDGPLFGGAP